MPDSVDREEMAVVVRSAHNVGLKTFERRKTWLHNEILFLDVS